MTTIRINAAAARSTGILFLGEPAIKALRYLNDRQCRYFDDRFANIRSQRMELQATATSAIAGEYTADDVQAIDALIAKERKALAISRASDNTFYWIDGALGAAGVAFGASALVAVISSSVEIFPHVLIATAAGAALYVVARAMRVVGVKALDKIKDMRAARKDAEAEVEGMVPAEPGRLGRIKRSAKVQRLLKALHKMWDMVVKAVNIIGLGSIGRRVRAFQVIEPVMTGVRGGSVTGASFAMMASITSMPTALATAVVVGMDYATRAGIEVPVKDVRIAMLVAGTVTAALIAAIAVRAVNKAIIAPRRAKKAAQAEEQAKVDITIGQATSALRAAEDTYEEAEALNELARGKEQAATNLLRKVTEEYREASDANDEAKRMLAEAKDAKSRSRAKKGATPKRPAVKKAAAKMPASVDHPLPTDLPKVDEGYDKAVKRATGLSTKQLADAAGHVA